jgi:hypothetical protein
MRHNRTAHIECSVKKSLKIPSNSESKSVHKVYKIFDIHKNQAPPSENFTKNSFKKIPTNPFTKPFPISITEIPKKKSFSSLSFPFTKTLIFLEREKNPTKKKLVKAIPSYSKK